MRIFTVSWNTCWSHFTNRTAKVWTFLKDVSNNRNKFITFIFALSNWLVISYIVSNHNYVEYAKILQIVITYIFMLPPFHSFFHQWLYSPLLGPGLFFSFVIFFTVGRTPWTSDQPIARPLPTHRTTQTQNNCTHTHPCLKWDSNPRSQCSRERREFRLRPRGHCDRPCYLHCLPLSDPTHTHSS
jgi:hypothetical protein